MAMVSTGSLDFFSLSANYCTSDKSSEKSNNKSSSQSNKKQKWVNYRKAAKNIKTNYSSLPKSTDHDEIRKQVDFYFSDSNLAYDDFMHSLVVDGRNENKAVPIYKIHTFKRMRRFQPLSVVVEALRGSTVVDVVGDNQDEIRRKVPFKKPETNNEFEDPTITRSIYVKGFGREGSTTQFDIESLFAPYGPVSMVRLRRTYPDRLFKGSVFVEFETDDIQKQFLDLEDKPKWQGKVLDIMSKQSYCEMKLADIDAGKIGPSNKFQFKLVQSPSYSACHRLTVLQAVRSPTQVQRRKHLRVPPGTESPRLAR
jgi:lupus La protein